jgi:hypothetical protein
MQNPSVDILSIFIDSSRHIGAMLRVDIRFLKPRSYISQLVDRGTYRLLLAIFAAR